MKSPFFSRRVKLFGNVAIAILFVVFFLVPFAFRGARLAVRGIRNDIKDWLPADFPETAELDWFREHFLNEQFVVVSWPGCSEDHPSYQLYVDKLRAETIPADGLVLDATTEEQPVEQLSDLEKKKRWYEQKARDLGDRLGLNNPGDPDFFENWGGLHEKWILGDEHWYYITPDGKLYEWSGRDNIFGWMGRSIEKKVTGKNTASGEVIADFGSPDRPDAAANEFYENPRKLYARYFKTVTTGPQVLEQLAGENGSLRRGDDAEAAERARQTAYERLAGNLFGPHPPVDFHWTTDSFEAVLPEYKKSQLPKGWQAKFEHFVKELVELKYDGDLKKLKKSPKRVRAEHWDELFAALNMKPMGRQTCVLITLTDPAKRDLSRVVGRKVMGKPYGRVLDMAFNECGVDEAELRLGGPPVDNVSIDQEASITLLRLVFWSAAVGMGLAYVCFRSVKVTMMVFFIGGVSAAASLGIVWWTGGTLDAIVMSMPSLVYVLGLSGAVHIVNYYRDAAQEKGIEGAPETAIRYGWFPCTLAAFTTALGLISLCVSNLTPIKKFGFYSALGVLATLILLFTYLPSVLTVWTPWSKEANDKNKSNPTRMSQLLSGFWHHVGGVVVKRHSWVAAGCVAILVIFAFGLPKITPSVQLLKLFHKDAQIIKDYNWLEKHLAMLVPMEVIVCVDKEAQRPTLDAIEADEQGKLAISPLQYGFLERAEMAERIHDVLESTFGEEGQRIVGRGMSVKTVLPDFPTQKGGTILNERSSFSRMVEKNRDQILKSDYLQIDNHDDRELWRVSLRLGALNDVDYGVFVGDLKLAVEPVMSAYRSRSQILRFLNERKSPDNDGRMRVLVLAGSAAQEVSTSQRASGVSLEDDAKGGINQTQIYASTLHDLMLNRGYRTATKRNRAPTLEIAWQSPDSESSVQPKTNEQWAQYLKGFDCVVVAQDHDQYNMDLIRANSGILIDGRGHQYKNASNSLTAAELKRQGDKDTTVTVTYTGIVPIVYKAQRTLLHSLVNSIALSFAMIVVVMMLLLRDWKRPVSVRNSLNLPAGLVSMMPNVFPVILIFGAMGHFGIIVDIGTMMTASVAMGIAVDDTIHFLNWFRRGMRLGLSRHAAIELAYERCGTAMTQTTLIGGFGLAVFAFSTFTPTQQFGIMMLLLLQAALVGDLIFLPALLAGPLGRYFEVSANPPDEIDSLDGMKAAEIDKSTAGATPHSSAKAREKATVFVRQDGRHEGLG